MPAPDLLVLGDVNPDVIVRAIGVRPTFGQQEQLVDDVILTIGGSAAIMATAATQLGLRTTIIGAVGDDPFGHLTVDALAARGVDVSLVRIMAGHATGVSVVIADVEDRAILTARGAIPMLTLSDIPRATLEAARHVHVASYFLLDGLQASVPEVFDLVHGSGGTTSLDVNWDPGERWDSGLDQVLSRTDVFFPNLAEAERISRQSDPERAARDLLARGVGLVAMKLGSAGGLVMSAESQAIRRPAIPVAVVDSTGAGDSFDAGFLAGWLPARSAVDGLEMGVAAGSLATRAVGGTGGQPTIDEVRRAQPGFVSPTPDGGFGS